MSRTDQDCRLTTSRASDAPIETARTWISSRYNFWVATDAEPLLYSARTGALVSVAGPQAQPVIDELCGAPSPVGLGLYPRELRNDLVEGGFVVPEGFDELAAIRTAYWRARRATPMVLTITTTMDCNLGCYYCYEDRTGDALSLCDVDSIVAMTESRLLASGKRSLHVDWYGGEPLLNLQFLEAASEALQSLCRRQRVGYAASVVSNGTCWPDDVEGFVGRHCIGQVQVSFDGLPANHNRRRHFRSGRDADGRSSFELIVALVDRLVTCVAVDLRINIDRGNQNDLDGLLTLFESRGWFGGRYPVTVQPARLSAYSERSEFMREAQLSLEEFDTLRTKMRQCVGGRVRVEESEVPDQYPYPRNSVCAALADASVVAGADRRLYRCGLQVSEPERAVGAIESRSTNGQALLPIIDRTETAHDEQLTWWEQFDPTVQPTCSACSFLPVCWGGCPKKHLECDRSALSEQGEYWRTNLARLIASHVGRQPAAGFVYSEGDQFR